MGLLGRQTAFVFIFVPIQGLGPIQVRLLGPSPPISFVAWISMNSSRELINLKWVLGNTYENQFEVDFLMSISFAIGIKLTHIYTYCIDLHCIDLHILYIILFFYKHFGFIIIRVLTMVFQIF